MDSVHTKIGSYFKAFIEDIRLKYGIVNLYTGYIIYVPIGYLHSTDFFLLITKLKWVRSCKKICEWESHGMQKSCSIFGHVLDY